MPNRFALRAGLRGLAMLAAAALLCLAYATIVEPFRPVIRRRTIIVPATWPALSILHLSDLHVRSGADRLFRAQRAVLRRCLDSDVVVVTGDLCETLADVDRTIELLAEVQPRFGTFAVLGNHEHDVHRPDSTHEERLPGWARILTLLITAAARGPRRQAGQSFAIARQLTEGGVNVLVNRGTRLNVNERTLWIAGSDSAWSRGADLAAAMQGRDAADGCMALVHEPELAFAAQEMGSELILAGHTHGGQVRLPIIGAPYTHRVDRRVQIPAGIQRIGNAVLHVNAGLGHSVPLRFACPPEAVLLECVPRACHRRDQIR